MEGENNLEKLEMIALVSVNYEGEKPTVSGRELHAALEIGTEYAKWFERMAEYGFIEGEDYSTILTNRSDGKAGKPRTNHALTISMAKELCMLQRNEKGKTFRQYFIKVEEAWNSPEMVMKRALDYANRRVEELTSKIEQDEPKVAFADKVADASNLIDVGQMAKLLYDQDIPIGRNRLFTWLRKEKYLRNNNEPYQRYIDNGIFEVKELTYATPYGQQVSTKTYITGKGQIFIAETLRKKFSEKWYK